MLAPLATVLLALVAPAGPERLLDLVRPIVGTAREDQRIGAVNSGQTFPAVGVPFGMTHWTPQGTFYAQDGRIQGIRASHWWSGSCAHDYGSVTIAATTGPLRLGAEERALKNAAQTPPYEEYADGKGRRALSDYLSLGYADGRWVEAFDAAAETSWITEGTPWHYTFFVPHDVAGLMEAMGGREAFLARLDRLFGDPGSPHYEIGSPLFGEARVDVGSGRTFTLRAPGASASSSYVQSATLDGRPHDRPWIAHADVARGATLELKMGSRPNRAWGARPEDAPPSLSTTR